MSIIIFSPENKGREVYLRRGKPDAQGETAQKEKLPDVISYVSASGEWFRIERETNTVGGVIRGYDLNDITRADDLLISTDNKKTWRRIAVMSENAED